MNLDKKLKQQFNVVVQYKRKPGEPRVRFIVSINRLGDYIGEKRAKFIIKNLIKSMEHKKRYSVQNKATVDIYLK
jgi:hypothetical protein